MADANNSSDKEGSMPSDTAAAAAAPKVESLSVPPTVALASTCGEGDSESSNEGSGDKENDTPSTEAAKGNASTGDASHCGSSCLEDSKDSGIWQKSSGPSEQKQTTGPRVRYVTEYRDSTSVLERHDTENPPEPDSDEDDLPSFEVVQTFRYTGHGLDRDDDWRQAAKKKVGMSAPQYSVRIYAPEIINALRSVVKYYPGNELQGVKIEIRKPYAILAHHFTELSEFADLCETRPEDELCVREKNAPRHIRLLLDFLEEHVMKGYRAEKERLKQRRSTFEWYWVALKPGTLVIEERAGKSDYSHNSAGDFPLMVGVVHSVEGGSFSTPPQDWLIHVWRLKFTGKEFLTRVKGWSMMPKWDGEREDPYSAFPYQDLSSLMEHPAAKRLLQSGEAYWNLLKKQCKHYTGKSAVFPYNQVDGVVMSDIRSYLASKSIHAQDVSQDCLDEEDIRSWVTDCECARCKAAKYEKSRESKWATLSSVEIELGIEDYDEETRKLAFLLLPNHIPAYVFRTRTWERLYVNKFREPKFNEEMIDNLVMPEKRLKTLKALSKSFIRIDSTGEPMGHAHQWAADFVEGKGNGLIFLLHGSPGVGKTYTAECIADYTKRPLMVLTSSDIGTDPAQVEINLTRNFKTAMSWQAVLLIDEADVFMERRTVQDLVRNSLVAGFLRALEFYNGILFLTTNRIGSFDDAFMSRIHVHLRYPEFTDDDRKRVWQTFMNKLKKERGDTMRLTMDAKDYVNGKEMRKLKWNGREIRNAFQTAVALAEFDAKKDEENRIEITDDHLRSVVELSGDFKKYLEVLHCGDEAHRAQRRTERLGSHPPKGEVEE
ncbi:hypothetical protein MAPG_07112 [Magnaporthiopsis poae ATCC 64411]|uniref:AAA+ ATPase domain-containing protein n=1 Tax=Magnaporthiopsis poae (strain ATCC 64411 / 73-15) TaxID=644358 RepID=A0A0C4E3U1_MAGP6|nr:hypothetical protein MAPG_07112 [Magnaporthiopsis poae ATCC 64411]